MDRRHFMQCAAAGALGAALPMGGLPVKREALGPQGPVGAPGPLGEELETIEGALYLGSRYRGGALVEPRMEPGAIKLLLFDDYMCYWRTRGCWATDLNKKLPKFEDPGLAAQSEAIWHNMLLSEKNAAWYGNDTWLALYCQRCAPTYAVHTDLHKYWGEESTQWRLYGRTLVGEAAAAVHRQEMYPGRAGWPVFEVHDFELI